MHHDRISRSRWLDRWLVFSFCVSFTFASARPPRARSLYLPERGGSITDIPCDVLLCNDLRKREWTLGGCGMELFINIMHAFLCDIRNSIEINEPIKRFIHWIPKRLTSNSLLDCIFSPQKERSHNNCCFLHLRYIKRLRCFVKKYKRSFLQVRMLSRNFYL